MSALSWEHFFFKITEDANSHSVEMQSGVLYSTIPARRVVMVVSLIFSLFLFRVHYSAFKVNIKKKLRKKRELYLLLLI